MSTLNCDKKTKPPPPPWTQPLPEAVYHREALSGRYVSSGMLKEFRRCPAHYRRLILGTAERPVSDAFRIGRGLHKLLLEGESAFRAAFTVGGPVNPHTGTSFGPGTQAFARWLAENGLDRSSALTSREAENIRAMHASASSHPEIARILKDGWPEVSARCEMEGVACQIRLDWLCPDGTAVDVKTAADISRFEDDARRWGYLHQFAFYRDGARAAGGGGLGITALVLEKKPPHRAGVWHFSSSALDPYSAENSRSLQALRRCRESGRWPTGYESPRTFPPAGIPPVWLN